MSNAPLQQPNSEQTQDFVTKTLAEMRDIAKTQRIQGWSPSRQRICAILEDSRFDCIVSFVILVHLVLLVCEAELLSEGRGVSGIESINKVFVYIFSIELGVRLYTYRSAFVHDLTSVIDGLVIVVDIVLSLLGGLPVMGMLRIVRLVRLMRLANVIDNIPQLRVMVRSFGGALETLFWGAVMLLFMLVIWGVFAVEIIKPINEEVAASGAYEDCDRCHRAYSTVWMSVLTFMQQIVAGDSWGMVTLPIVEHRPATLIFFGLVFVSLSMAVMNLILASVVDAVAQARLSHDEYIVEEKRKEITAGRHALEGVCKRMDTDASGTLSISELEHGYNHELDFRMALEAMDVRPSDLPAVFRMLDVNADGVASYTEFCDQIQRMKSNDVRTMMTFTRYYVDIIHKDVHEMLLSMREEVVKGIQDEKNQLNKISNMESQFAMQLDQISRTDASAHALSSIPDDRKDGNSTLSEAGMRACDEVLTNRFKTIVDFMKDSVERMNDSIRIVEASLFNLGDVKTASAADEVPLLVGEQTFPSSVDSPCLLSNILSKKFTESEVGSENVSPHIGSASGSGTMRTICSV